MCWTNDGKVKVSGNSIRPYSYIFSTPAGYDKGLIQIEWMVKKERGRYRRFAMRGQKEEAVKDDSKIQN